MTPPVVPHALLATDNVLLEKTRRFPLTGDILVEKGDRVQPDTLLGYHSAEERLHVMKIDVHDARLQGMLIKRPGDTVKRGETIALSTFFAGLGITEYCAPVDGTVVSVDTVTGSVVIREFPEPLKALLPGVVSDIHSNEAVSISCRGAYIEGVYALGQSNGGRLAVLVNSADESISAQHISYKYAGCVIVIGCSCNHEHLMAALKSRVCGVITAAADLDGLSRFARLVTGLDKQEYETRFGASHDRRSRFEDDEWTPVLPVIVTEGFGEAPMRDTVFRLLKKHEGKYAYVHIPGPYSEYAEPPQVLVPHDAPEDASAACREPRIEIRQGLRVRLIGSCRFGQVGVVEDIVSQDTGLRAGSCVLSVRVRLLSGECVTVPKNNVEVVDS